MVVVVPRHRTHFWFVDSLLQPIAQNKENYYIRDTTHFINLSIENTPLSEAAILATLDGCSLCTNIPHEEGIEIVWPFYKEHYQSNLYLSLINFSLILTENSFKFNNKHYLQTHGTAMVTKMAVAFSVIFMAHIEKQLLIASPYKPFLWKRFIDDIFSV